jgi:hypothetical protein
MSKSLIEVIIYDDLVIIKTLNNNLLKELVSLALPYWKALTKYII